MKGVRVNLEAECAVDFIFNRGFWIEKDSYGQIDVDHLINADDFTNTEFSCDCGKYSGRDLLGEKCPSCGSEITLRSLDFKKTGWMNIYPHHVLTPAYYGIIKRVINANYLRFILGDYKNTKQIKYVNDDNDDSDDTTENTGKKRGRVSPDDIKNIIKKIPKAKHKYQGIGLDGFYENFEEIILGCMNKNNTKEIEMILSEKHIAFTSKIPVFSTAFRPVSKTSESFFYPKINKFYAQMCAVYCSLNDTTIVEEQINALNSFQKFWLEAVDHLISNEIAEKSGLVRSEIVGGTFEFSMRGVITLDTTLRMDEIDVPAPALMTLFQYKVAHRIHTRYNTTLEQAYLMINTNKHPEITYGILQEILDEGIWVMLLREPTNNLASNALIRIRRMKFDDDTISISEPVLAGYNADFDGDQLNGFIVPNEHLQYWEKFHYSCLADFIHDEVKIPSKEWTSVTTALITS